MESSRQSTATLEMSTLTLLPDPSASPATDPAGELQPEKRLMFAVLADAIRTATQQEVAVRQRRCQLIREAKAWFAADDQEWPFSFVSICDALGIDAARLRRRLALTLALAGRYKSAQCTSTTRRNSASSATSCAPTSAAS